MALENLSPIVREERLLAGEDLEPANRLEYFLKQAGSGGSGSAVFDFVIINNGTDLILQSGNYDAVRAKLSNGVPVLGVYSNQSTSNIISIEFPTSIEIGTSDIALVISGNYLIWDNENNLIWD